MSARQDVLGAPSGRRTALEEHDLVDRPRGDRPAPARRARTDRRRSVGARKRASVRWARNGSLSARVYPSGASRCSTAFASSRIHAAPSHRPSATMRARRAIAQRVRRPRAAPRPGRRSKGPACKRRRHRVDVGVVAEELQRDVPLLARRSASVPASTPTRRAPSIASSTAAGGRDRDERARHRSASCRRDRSRCLRDRASRSNSRRPRTPAAALTRVAPSATQRAASASMSSTIRSRCTRFFADLRLGHLLEHDRRPARTVRRARTTGSSPVCAARPVAERLAVERAQRVGVGAVDVDLDLDHRSPRSKHVESLAQQVEQRDRRELAQPLAVAGQPRAHRPRSADPGSRGRRTRCRPRRRPARSARDTRRRDADVGAEHTLRGLGHLARRLLAHDRLRGDAEHRPLHVGRVATRSCRGTCRSHLRR